MAREIPVEDLPKEIRKDAPYIADGFLSEIDALEENADRAEAKGIDPEQPLDEGAGPNSA